MRLILLALMLLLAGCLGQEAAPPAQNQSAAQDAMTSANPVPPQDNATAIPEASGNLTVAPSDSPPAGGSITSPSENPQGNETGTPQNHAPDGTSPPALGAEDPKPGTRNPPEGLAFANGSYVLAFDDASVIPVSSEPCGIFSLWAINGTLLEKMLICPGESEVWASPEGATYRIEVVSVAAGYSGAEAWAKVIIFG
ncbi:hypothetical protein L0Y65_03320 [Candidatus Micrarchaeota archaeon]|nr:hypothetical protein [Candidatus Micrarchaeota archaeon]